MTLDEIMARTVRARGSLDTDCWIWVGPKCRGYGYCYFEGRNRPVHCVVHEQMVGEVPDGHERHHRCERLDCCNPDHIEVLTFKEHHAAHPLKGRAGKNAAKATCKNGHPFDATNAQGARICKKCTKSNAAAYYQRRKLLCVP